MELSAAAADGLAASNRRITASLADLERRRFEIDEYFPKRGGMARRLLAWAAWLSSHGDHATEVGRRLENLLSYLPNTPRAATYAAALRSRVEAACAWEERVSQVAGAQPSTTLIVEAVRRAGLGEPSTRIAAALGRTTWITAIDAAAAAMTAAPDDAADLLAAADAAVFQRVSDGRELCLQEQAVDDRARGLGPRLPPRPPAINESAATVVEPVLLRPPEAWSPPVMAPRELDEAEPEAESPGLDDLDELTDPGGLVSEIVNWMEDTCDRPNRALFLAAALGWVATLAGRRFSIGDKDARTNLYLLTLAPSGYGKDHAIQMISRLAATSRLDKYLGPSRVMSASALRNFIKREPRALLQIDEFGGFMRQITDKRAGVHNSAMKDDLLEYFSRASTVFQGAEYADRPAERIYAPNVSLSGTSTPDSFWPSVGAMAEADGLLARFIYINVTGSKPPRRTPLADIRHVPDSLARWSQELAAARPGGNLATSATAAPEPLVVPMTDDAGLHLDRFREHLETLTESADVRAKPTLNRVVEHALKLALTVAVGTDHEAPVVSAPIMGWACRLAHHSAATLIEEARDRIADNEREAALNRVLRLVKDAGSGGITKGKIVDKTRGLDPRGRDAILSDLQVSGRVRFVSTATPAGRVAERFVATRRA